MLDIDPFFRTPWRRGRRLVDEHGRPLRADEIEQKVFYTAYPEGADREQYGSPLVVVRLDPRELDLPPERQGWAPRGIVAYSKICTHAGCAVSLYRVPTFAPVEPKPALVCPCHYSTFDPARGGERALRPGRTAAAAAAAPRSTRTATSAPPATSPGAVGPSWWGVRNRRPKP